MNEMHAQLDEILAEAKLIPAASTNEEQSRAVLRAGVDAAELAMLALLLDWVAKDLVPARLSTGMMRDVRTVMNSVKDKIGC